MSSEAPPLLSASILAADFCSLGQAVQEALDAGVQRIHVDVMDGHFVPNLTIGVPVVRSLKARFSAPIEVHLMIQRPDDLLEAFVDAGAETVIVHQEVCSHLDRTLRRIRQMGASPGVAVNPATPVAMLTEVLELIDVVLVMTVNPGFAGQAFLPHTLRKVTQLNQIRQQHRLRYRIEVDGGINDTTIGQARAAGADWFVAASAIFGTNQPIAESVARLLAILRQTG